MCEFQQMIEHEIALDVGRNENVYGVRSSRKTRIFLDRAKNIIIYASWVQISNARLFSLFNWL